MQSGEDYTKIKAGYFLHTVYPPEIVSVTTTSEQDIYGMIIDPFQVTYGSLRYEFKILR